MIDRDVLDQVLNETLQPERFTDYSPNGLQVEGRSRIRRLVSGVTACQALVDAAIVEEADAILVHHGYFWKGEDQRIQGMKKQRLQSLLRHDINLFAYHLPLDAHPELGNNVQLARVLGLRVDGGMEPDNPLSLGNTGRLDSPMTAREFAAQAEEALGRSVLHVGDPDDEIATLAWCTGAAQGFIDRARELGVDAYLSGEISEPTTHSARETGLHYFACGHHATERYGVQAVGEWLADEYGLEHIYIDIDNPA
jgi:dinuclear metal center YbgI/SA1388 family protein